MNNINRYKRLLLQENIETCRELLATNFPKRKTAILTEEEKSTFFELGMNLKTFLSNRTEPGKKVTISELADDYIHVPERKLTNTLFAIYNTGVNKKVATELLKCIERTADENFGTLEEAKAMQ